MLRLQEAERAAGSRPARGVVGARDYDALKRDMLRYGFSESKHYPKPLSVLNVPIVKDLLDGEPVEHRTIRFEWSE